MQYFYLGIVLGLIIMQICYLIIVLGLIIIQLLAVSCFDGATLLKAQLRAFYVMLDS